MHRTQRKDVLKCCFGAKPLPTRMALITFSPQELKFKKRHYLIPQNFLVDLSFAEPPQSSKMNFPKGFYIRHFSERQMQPFADFHQNRCS